VEHHHPEVESLQPEEVSVTTVVKKSLELSLEDGLTSGERRTADEIMLAN